METDLAFAAAGAAFVRAYAHVYDEMARRGYYRHREEGRAMPPRFEHVALSDAAAADYRSGWRTRWRWLDYPTAVYLPGVRYDGAAIVRTAREQAALLATLRSPNVSVRRLTPVPPVPRFCAESAFLHHTLEAAAVAPLEGVTLERRDKRCPDGGSRGHRGAMRSCTGWLV